MTKTKQPKVRLDEIAETRFGELSDDQVLQLLAERKQLQSLLAQYEQVQKAEEAKSRAQSEKAAIEQELGRLNALINPDKPDDELIHLIEERKTWEAKLEAVEETLAELGVVETEAPTTKKETVPESVPIPVSVPASEPRTEAPSKESGLEEVPVAKSVIGQEGILKASIDKDFGEHKILETTIDPSSELGRYLEQIERSPDSMGTILDGLPVSAKRDKDFMLAVAAIDPAYAMHYADKDVLKKDEDFNLRVVATKGQRASGSVLAEMLPEARTEAVVMAALKQDYRNIRFALPQMREYDKMLERAKKAALEKVRELKESVDISMLVPKILQKDKSFMEKVEKIAPSEGDK